MHSGTLFPHSRSYNYIRNHRCGLVVSYISAWTKYSGTRASGCPLVDRQKIWEFLEPRYGRIWEFSPFFQFFLQKYGKYGNFEPAFWLAMVPNFCETRKWKFWTHFWCMHHSPGFVHNRLVKLIKKREIQ